MVTLSEKAQLILIQMRGEQDKRGGAQSVGRFHVTKSNYLKDINEEEKEEIWNELIKQRYIEEKIKDGKTVYCLTSTGYQIGGKLPKNVFSPGFTGVIQKHAHIHTLLSLMLAIVMLCFAWQSYDLQNKIAIQEEPLVIFTLEDNIILEPSTGYNFPVQFYNQKDHKIIISSPLISLPTGHGFSKIPQQDTYPIGQSAEQGRLSDIPSSKTTNIEIPKRSTYTAHFLFETPIPPKNTQFTLKVCTTIINTDQEKCQEFIVTVKGLSKS